MAIPADKVIKVLDSREALKYLRENELPTLISKVKWLNKYKQDSSVIAVGPGAFLCRLEEVDVFVEYMNGKYRAVILHSLEYNTNLNEFCCMTHKTYHTPETLALLMAKSAPCVRKNVIGARIPSDTTRREVVTPSAPSPYGSALGNPPAPNTTQPCNFEPPITHGHGGGFGATPPTYGGAHNPKNNQIDLELTSLVTNMKTRITINLLEHGILVLAKMNNTPIPHRTPLSESIQSYLTGLYNSLELSKPLLKDAVVNVIKEVLEDGIYSEVFVDTTSMSTAAAATFRDNYMRDRGVKAEVVSVPRFTQIGGNILGTTHIVIAKLKYEVKVL